MDYRQHVISIIEKLYVSRLTENTGLGFHVETTKREGEMMFSWYMGKTIHYYEDGKVTAKVVCDQEGYDPCIKFEAPTWEKLDKVLDMTLHAERVMKWTAKRGAEIIAD